MTERELTTTLLENIQTKVSKQVYEAYLLDLQVISSQNNILTIACKNIFTKQAIENRFHNTILNTVRTMLGNNDFQIEFVIKSILDKKNPITSSSDLFAPTPRSSEAQTNETQRQQLQPITSSSKDSFLNSKYTFDTFIVGSHNQMAHAAGLAIAENPGNAYNPFFIYGGVGLGKTHLMQAIGHKVLDQNPNAKVLYSPTELFLNEMIQGIRTQKMSAFHKKYREIDLLILDDIQFISNKVGLQEEFFNTFNTLYQAGKQIIIASDRPPTEIAHLEDRIRSRFEGGLVADVKGPNVETRVAILQKKLIERNEFIPESIITAIAEIVDTNIRELEGALLKVSIFYKTTNNITVKDVESLLGQKVLAKRKKINPLDIVKIVCEELQIEMKEVKSSKRNYDIAYARQICMYLLKDILKLQLVKIAKHVGRRDHTTVMHGVNKIEEMIGKDQDTARLIAELKSKINN
jgi:chromosomal replication initiator protein